MEGLDETCLVGFDDTELARLVAINRDRCDGDACTRCDVLVDHLTGVHSIDVVSTKDRHVVGSFVVNEVEVLIDRVGRSLEPLWAAAHLCRHRRHIVVEERGESPGLRDVAVEAMALVLREYNDFEIAGIREVR